MGDKLEKAKAIMREINKQHKEVVIDFASNQRESSRLSTGIKELDNLIGGGWAYGHCNIIWGQSSAGKSSLMLHSISQAQSEGKVVAFLDLENSFDEQRAKSFGVNTQELLLGHYEIAEKALDTIILLAREQAVDVIILDSIHSLAPKGEVEDKKGTKSLESDTMALLARKMAQFFRMSSTLIYKANIALVMVGQTRTDLGGFIALQKLSGGNALIHNSVLTLHLRRGSKSDAPRKKWKEIFLDPDGKLHKKTKDEPIGFDTVIKIDKKQVTGGESEGSEKHLSFYYDSGFVASDAEIEEVIVGTEEEKEKIQEILNKKEKFSQVKLNPKSKKRGRPKKK